MHLTIIVIFYLANQLYQLMLRTWDVIKVPHFYKQSLNPIMHSPFPIKKFNIYVFNILHKKSIKYLVQIKALKFWLWT